MSDEIHGEDYFHFGDKVTYWFNPYGPMRVCTHLVVLGVARAQTKDCLLCADENGGVSVIHPRLLDLGWNKEQL